MSTTVQRMYLGLILLSVRSVIMFACFIDTLHLLDTMFLFLFRYSSCSATVLTRKARSVSTPSVLKNCCVSLVSSLLGRSVWSYWCVTYLSKGARTEHLYAQVHASTPHLPRLEAVSIIAIPKTFQVFVDHSRLLHLNQRCLLPWLEGL